MLFPAHHLQLGKVIGEGSEHINAMKDDYGLFITLQVNEKSCRLRMATYRDGDKIGMGL